MSYQVTARKWRPQRFEEVVGQENVTRTLQNAIRCDRIAHAFLFSGVRGVGKTSAARILAKALNCSQGPTDEPCGQCVSCQEIAAGSSLDVLEIDAASNRGIDSIRELRESVRYGSARDRFKIFIIDEVHMLTNEAFNALLKTLEEPPPHVKFILATTEHHKIPVTITSRCQQYEFKPIPFLLILERLKTITNREEIEAGDFALRAIASMAEGSMRDAQSLLDQMVAFGGREIRDEDVRTILGAVDTRLVAEAIESVLSRDREALLKLVESLSTQGIGPQNFCRKLIEHVRNLMVCKVAGWDERLLHLPDSEKEMVERQAGRFSELDLIRLYDLVNRIDGELRWHTYPYVHLEMMLLKMVELAQLPRVEEVIGQLRKGGVINAAEAPPPEPPPAARSTSTAPEKEREPETAAGGEADLQRTAAAGLNQWDQIVNAVQQQAMGLYSSLKHAEETRLSNGRLTIRFSSSEAFHRGVIQEPENMQRLKRICSAVLGSIPEIDVQVSEAEAPPQSEPTSDPRVQDFISRFPGKIVVDKNLEE